MQIIQMSKTKQIQPLLNVLIIYKYCTIQNAIMHTVLLIIIIIITFPYIDFYNF